MTSQRFHHNTEAGQQLYAIVETCRRPEALWAKLSSGHYDWLGVRRNGHYLVGRPRLAAMVEHGDEPDEVEPLDPHRVEIGGPLDRRVHHEGHPTPEQARAAYEGLIAGDPVTPLRSSGIWKIRLMVDDQSIEERLVVRTLPQVF